MQTDIESFTDYLRWQLEKNPPKRKGERTRDRIKLAAACVLEESGFHEMRVSDITKHAGSSDGTFYMYFTDKKDIALTVLGEFLRGMQLGAKTQPGSRPRDVFTMIYDGNLNWIQAVRANAGLMRSALQLSDEDIEFRKLVHSSNREWHRRIADSVVRHHENEKVDLPVAYFAASALGAMMDELMRRIVVYPDQDFIRFLDETIKNDKELATALAVIWFRVLYPERTPPVELKGIARALWQIGVPAVKAKHG